MIITPRFHLLEIGDQPWCPEFLREYSHLARMHMWNISSGGGGGTGVKAQTTTMTPASFACDVLLAHIADLSAYVLVDPCAGAGGPIPIMEPALNAKLAERGRPPVRFVLSDLWPAVERWEVIAKRSANISFVAEPRDATKVARTAGEREKECRVFNLCFHHFDNGVAELVLRSAVESADAFV